MRISDIIYHLSFIRYHFINLIVLLPGFCFFSVSPLHAQKAKTIQYLSELPVVDGIVDPVDLMNVDYDTFTQLEPNKDSAATQQIKFIIAQDSNNIYFGIVCYQPEPVVAKIQSRDHLSKNDDLVLLMIGAYNDQRNGYGFFVNPLGTQIDMQISDDGRIIDLNWDTEWTSAVTIFEGGWQAEMIIPFQSIKYKQNTDQWDFNVGRVYRFNSETTYWSGAMSDDFRMSQSGLLNGLILPGRESKVSIFPYATLKFEKSTETETKENFEFNAGGDLLWHIIPTLSANATYNPDFATIEADPEQINLTRYELSYPEKRLFFQEGNEMFSTRIRTFYSRRIGDIDFGGKLNGKVGGYNVNILGLRSKEIPEMEEPQSYFVAARVKRDILKSSSVGLTFVDKAWKGGSTGSLSGDYLLNIGKTWKLTGQAVASYSGNLSSNSAFFLRFARENNIYHYHIRFTSIGDNFKENVNQTGFIVDDDRQEIDADISYVWWIQNKTFKYIEVYSGNNIFWSQRGVLRSWYFTNLVEFYFQNRMSIEFYYNNEFKLFEKKYYNHKYGIELGYNTDEWSSASLNYLWGRNFDRNFDLLEAEGQFKLSNKLAVEYSGNWLHYDPDTTNSTTFINILSLQYNITNDLWFKVFAQNNSSIDRFYFYGLFGWRFKPPFGAVYLIYTRDEFLEYPQDIGYEGQVVYLKFTYPVHF